MSTRDGSEHGSGASVDPGATGAATGAVDIIKRADVVAMLRARAEAELRRGRMLFAGSWICSDAGLIAAKALRDAADALERGEGP